jgi:hypothetical protein
MGFHPRHAPRGTRIIDGIRVDLVEQTWSGGDRSFQAYLPDGTDLAADEAFDCRPTDAQLRELLDEHRGIWRCTCGTPFAAADTDLIGDHVADCPAATATPVGGRR